MQMATDVKYALKNLPVFSTVTEYIGISGANYLSASSPKAPGGTGVGDERGKARFQSWRACPLEAVIIRRVIFLSILLTMFRRR